MFFRSSKNILSAKQIQVKETQNGKARTGALCSNIQIHLWQATILALLIVLFTPIAETSKLPLAVNDPMWQRKFRKLKSTFYLVKSKTVLNLNKQTKG